MTIGQDNNFFKTKIYQDISNYFHMNHDTTKYVLANEEIKNILFDLEIRTNLKEELDKILFSDLEIRKKRIKIRKLKRKGLDKKYINVFINLLEYIEKS